MAVLSDKEVDAALPELDGWERVDNALRRSVKFPAFLTGIDAVRRIAEAAETADHHPDIDIRWRTVTFVLSTQALQDGVPQGVVLMDAGYGVNTALREGVTALGLNYAAGIQPQTSVWKQGEGPLPPKSFSGNGRPPKLMRRDKEHRPLSVKELALGLPESDSETITWREGACEPLSSRFARVRVRPSPSRLRSDRAKAGRMASDRVAGARSRAHQILVLNSPRRHRFYLACGHNQTALAD